MFGRKAEYWNVENLLSSAWTVNERVGKHFWPNHDKIYGNAAIDDHNFAIFGQQKY